jgi:hypothetical protein
LLISSNLSYASTIIRNGDLDNGAVWDKQGSPYILVEDVYLPDNFTLYIDEGASVISASSTSAKILTIDGDIKINGTYSEPVIFDNLDQIYFSNSNVNIVSAVFSKTSLVLWQSTTSISNTIIKDSDIGIKIMGSKVDINESRIIGNKIGLASYPILDNPVLMFIRPKLVYADNHDYGINHNSIYVFNSIISGNSNFGIQNFANNTIEASNNWWGSDSGPSQTVDNAGDRIYGLVNYNPWKMKDPSIKDICCSNVIFLPGLEASRLYSKNNTLWEPNRNADVMKLYLDENGQSINNTIYTKDIIDSAFSNTFNISNIYKSFIAMMNGVVAENYINSWLPFPYDWRMSVEDIVYGNTRLSTTSISLIDTVNNLSNISKTGKVTIVAHSNGGLVAKMLVNALTELNKSDLIDQVITIGTPVLGTPQAIPAILHGYQQSILGGFLMSENISRNLSKHSLGVLGLLPSRKFFESNRDNIVIDNYSLINKTINNYNNFIDFLLSNSFSKAITSDINTPILLNRNLLGKVESIHSSIDTWKFPTSTRLTTLLGWGIPTTKSLQYERDKHCKNKDTSKCPIAYHTIVSSSGDGTVTTNSVSSSSSNIYINLKNMNKDLKKDIEHANILESDNVLVEIKNKITKDNYSIENNKYFSNLIPNDDDTWLTIRLHSPIDIHIYDNAGRHTGVIHNPDPSKGKFHYEKGIPASYYADFGRIKMVSLPFNKDNEIVLEGNGSGVFTLEAELSKNDKIIASTSFEEIPVTPSLNAELLISTSTLNFASSTQLLIDENGDGITEYIHNKGPFKKKIKTITSKRSKRDRRMTTVDSPKRF